jgi:hypothetical protein
VDQLVEAVHREALWARDDRSEAVFSCELVFSADDATVRKPIILSPLPHP